MTKAPHHLSDQRFVAIIQKPVGLKCFFNSIHFSTPLKPSSIRPTTAISGKLINGYSRKHVPKQVTLYFFFIFEWQNLSTPKPKMTTSFFEKLSQLSNGIQIKRNEKNPFQFVLLHLKCFHLPFHTVSVSNKLKRVRVPPYKKFEKFINSF